jgi:hypothetical protein
MAIQNYLRLGADPGGERPDPVSRASGRPHFVKAGLETNISRTADGRRKFEPRLIANPIISWQLADPAG